jgi:uncharacterized membrane protein YczE
LADKIDDKDKGIMTEAKKVIVFREPLFATAMLLVSAGVTLMVRSGFGISVASSVPYVFSLYFTQLSFGIWTFVSYAVVILLLIVLIRHFEWLYLISFGISFLVSLLIDLFKYFWSFLPEQTLLLILYYFMGWLCLSLGIASFIKSELPPTPYELFIRDLAKFKNISFARSKTLFDLGCLTISLLFITFFLKRLTGIGVGTVVAGLLNGTLIGFWLRLMNRHFSMRSLRRE